jgi:AcrR family transcriptional regulator
MRRQPRQNRSRQRVEQILDTAAQMFSDIGYTNTTTNALAARMGMSIGSLYQFFPNKSAILAALGERYTAEREALYDELFDPALTESLTLREIIRRLIHALAKFEREHIAYQELFLSTVNRPHYVAEMHTEQRIARLLAHRFPNLDPVRGQRCATICTAIYKGVAPLGRGAEAETIQIELERALVAYIRAVLLADGVALPPD